METFGALLNRYRHQCRDPHSGGSLTQVSLGELMGNEPPYLGYSGTSISYWERNKSRIAKDDRLVLIALISVLHRCGGISSIEEANELLRAGNYRDLDSEEMLRAFPELDLEPLSKQGPASEDMEVTAEGYNGSSFKERRKQLLLLEKVHRFWIKGVLDPSIKETNLINLSYERRDDLVSQPWAGVIGSAAGPKPETSDTRSILKTYLAANRALLILGEPGAGKTITMLLLANELIQRARSNTSTPVPVMLNIGSWVEGHRTLSEWIVEELTSKYQIPRSIGRNWLEQDELVVMLDGVDAVPERFRPQCLQAINGFRQVRGLTGIVVCSRIKEYEGVNQSLLLGGAIVIRALNDRQVTEYLRVNGSTSSAFADVFRSELSLLEIARSPLMLNIVVHTFSHSWEDLKGIFGKTLKEKGFNAADWQRHVFEIYVQRMFQRRGKEAVYTQGQTERWLGWIAGQMFRFNSPQLLLEQIQPTWLVNRKWRAYYMTITGIFTGAAGTILMWLLLQLIRLSDPELPAPYFNEMLALLILNLVLGFFVAFLQGRYFEKLHIMEHKVKKNEKLFRLHLGIVGLLIGIVTASFSAFAGPLKLVPIWTASEVVIYITIASSIYGRSYSNEIRTVEALAWSWESATKGLSAGVLLMFISEAIEIILYRKPFHLESEYLLAATGLVLGGLRGRKVADVGRLYQGIYLSLRNSVWAAIISTIILGGLAYLIKFPNYAYVFAAMVFIVSGGILGGNNVIKHLLVRFLLWINGDLPWRLGKFLDYAASLAFLRKVGGGYIFHHRLLQGYFASLVLPSTEIDK